MEEPLSSGGPEVPLQSGIDSEIAAMRAEVSAMARRLDVLASALLSTEQAHALDDAEHHLPQDYDSLHNVLSKHHSQARLQSRRALLTATMFSTEDPDPYAPEDDRVYGIRIERYSRLQRKFLTPAYVFVHNTAASTESDEEVWRVHRHTLPAGIPVRALETKYLPEPPAEDQPITKRARQSQDLEAFVRQVSSEVVSLLRRQEAIESLQAPEIKTVSGMNAEATDLRIAWTAGAVARIRVSKSGIIEKVVAEKHHNRDAELERRILAASTLEALAAKL